ncbi:96ca82bc-67f3-4b3a-ab36-ffe7d8f40fbe [Dichotomopilus funicola]|uniref:96ca82bc-67f3-4b3a-ab36-ffe7d8f40fbe n=1 Tax=Dichotomopilus funicola TaxID=1934379 RepID=A0AAN6ZHI8_9PEZI|nr:96ca82bc-67f3-4b3a-ab36-ffe7d8f40fbe [Dichotomopilus funicola]
MRRHGLITRQQPPPSSSDGRSHEDLGPQLNTIFWLLASLATFFLALRFYCKLQRGRHLWWDDYVLAASWISLVVSASTTSACVALGYGKNLYDMNPDNLPTMPFIAVFAGFFSVLAAAWSKTSFALTLLRLSQAWVMKAVIWFIIVTVNAILGTAMLFMWIKCRPFAKIWDGSLEGWCIDPANIVILYQWSAGWSGGADCLLALMPWAILYRMQRTLDIKERVGIGIAMSMGVVAGAASFVKLAMLPNLTGTDSVAVTVWGSAEGAITIIAASIPVLRGLLRCEGDHSAGQFDTNDQYRLNTTSSQSFSAVPRKGDRLGVGTYAA